MSFTFQCPHCHHRLTVGDDWEGVETECPHCQSNVTITRAAEQDAPPKGRCSAFRKDLSKILVYGVLVILVILVLAVNLYLARNSATVAQTSPVEEESVPVMPEGDNAMTAEPPADNDEVPDESPQQTEIADSKGAQDAPEENQGRYRPPASQLSSYAHLLEAIREEGIKPEAIRQEDAQSFLMIACRKGDADVVEFLLDAKASPIAPGKGGLTPITLAVQSGHLDCLNLLLRNTNYVSKPDSNQRTPLYYAVSSNKLDIVEYLCHKGANVNEMQEDGTWFPLLAAIKNGNAEMVKLLLKLGAEVEKPDHEGRLPLYVAITSGQLKIVEAICWRRRRLNIHWEDGSTPLLTAIQADNAQMVKLLLDYDADPNLPDKAGKVLPIAVAEKGNNIEILELLLQHGAIPQRKNQETKATPQEILERLKANSAKNESSDDKRDEEEPASKGAVHLADILSGEKFRGNLKLVSNTQNKNLPPPFELTQPQKKIGIFVIHPGSSTHQEKSDRFFPPQMDHKITVFFSQKSLRNWGFVMETVKYYKPLELQKQIWEEFAKSETIGENQETDELKEELGDEDTGHLGDFIAAATQNTFKGGESGGGLWNQDQVFYNDRFLAVIYSHPYKRFSESIDSNKKCKLYLLYVDLECYHKACEELKQP